MTKESDPVVFLKGKRIYLRPPTKADIPYFLRWFNDPEVRQYLGLYLPMTEAEENNWIDELYKNQSRDIVLTIVDIKTDKPIGNMSIHEINSKNGTATTGATIGEKAFWNKGYGTEAKMLLLNYVFNSLNLRKVCSRVFDFNHRSLAYSKKCGYKIEGVLKKHNFKNGRYVDLVLMAVFREKWIPLWEKFRKAKGL